MKKTKAGFIAIIGRPNVGKSTLLNRLIGEKIVITSPKPQTTRSQIKGILTLPEKNSQIIFMDTPGIHKPLHLLGKTLVDTAKRTLTSADIVVFLVDGSVEAGKGDTYITELLKNLYVPVILVMNKMDLVAGSDKFLSSYKELMEFKNSFNISATKGDNVDKFLDSLVEILPDNPYFYDEDDITDKNERAIIAELIREQIFHLTSEEIPYSTAIIIDDMKDRSEELSYIAATVVVEKDSQKGMLIGDKGKKIKQIGSKSRETIEKFLGRKVFLDLKVKVIKNWRKEEDKIKRIIAEI